MLTSPRSDTLNHRVSVPSSDPPEAASTGTGGVTRTLVSLTAIKAPTSGMAATWSVTSSGTSKKSGSLIR